ncbi:hypothetical protein [Streptomyces sp. 8K308]|uniref:hypothetical protein n=1 Tax=Streptomyces sp. 8K308 TaxID=2530388 RepID=UPI001A9CE0AD|nr:hypothetical protein [Streptomyces sp. 8K308]
MVQRVATRSPSTIGPRSTVMVMSPKAAMVCSISGGDRAGPVTAVESLPSGRA